jgi:parallel beta-helix repeat protein
LVAVTLLALTFSAPRPASAQGPLTPPGPPGPTMLTLNQVEPRTPITNLPYTITSSGSYYLTTNLTACPSCTNGQNGITIAATGFPISIPTDNVTIDLSGFTLFGVAGSGHGIAGGSGYNIVIRNGTLRNWGVDGVNAYSCKNSKFDGLQLYENANIGIEAGVGSVVSDCRAHSNTVAGFALAMAGSGGEISHCVATDNGTGIVASTGCMLANCTASGNASDGFILSGSDIEISHCVAVNNAAIGILAMNGCTIADCTAGGNTGDGINVLTGTTVKSCTASQNGGCGVIASNNCTIISSTASSNTASGVSVQNNCAVIDCNAGGNAYGVYLNANGNTVRNCTAGGDTTDGLVANGNGNTVKDCTVSSSHIGIYVTGHYCLIAGNTCTGNSQFGIIIFGGQDCVDGNITGNNYNGIDDNAVNQGNTLTRNTSLGNSSANYYNYAGNNDYAPTGTPNTATSPWTNF